VREVSKTGSSDMPEVHRRKKKRKRTSHDPHDVSLKNTIEKRGWPQNSSEIAIAQWHSLCKNQKSAQM